MAIEVEKKNLSINQIIANKNELSIIEGDCIVPDVKPDIMSIIGTSGILSIYKREISDGKVRIDGSVSVYIMYNGNEGDGSSVRSINHVLDFSQIIIIDNAKSEMNDIGTVTIESIDCKMINERKINIKASLNFGVKLSTSTNAEYIDDINVKDLQKKNSKVNVNSVVGIGNTKTSISENMSINNADNIADILKVNTSILNTETKVSYNKVLIKSDVVVKILYSTEDGRFNTSQSTYPVMGFIDMEGVEEDNIISHNVEIKNCVIKQNGSQDHSIAVDMEIAMGIVVYSNKELDIINDMYSPSKNLNFSQKKVNVFQNSQTYSGVYSLNQKELLNIGDEKVYDVDTNVIASDIKVIDNAVLISGNIRFTFIHSTNKMHGLDKKVLATPFEYKMPCDGIKEGAQINLKSDIKNENYNIMPGGEAELKVDVSFTVNSTNMKEIKLIDDVKEDKENTQSPYNMIIYYTKRNDDLWNIAKQYKSTKKEIMKQNNLESEKIQPGTQLFITRQ